MGTLVRTYSDLDLSFERNPITRDVAKKIDANAVKQALRNLILTRFYERGFQPEFGSQIAALLFEPFTPVTQSTLQFMIRQAIENYEPRAIVNEVEVNENYESNSLEITINFTIINTNAPITYTFSVFRAR